MTLSGCRLDWRSVHKSSSSSSCSNPHIHPTVSQRFALEGALSGKIFINYRRGDDAGYTRSRLFASDSRQLFRPELLFMDVDNIEPGSGFRARAERAASRQCDVLISVIGKGWIDARDEAGTRRLDNPNDFVRIEIESAL